MNLTSSRSFDQDVERAQTPKTDLQLFKQTETIETRPVTKSLEQRDLQTHSNQTKVVVTQAKSSQGLQQIQSNTVSNIEAPPLIEFQKNSQSSTKLSLGNSPNIQLSTATPESENVPLTKETKVNETQSINSQDIKTKVDTFNSSLLNIFEQQKVLFDLYQQECRREFLKYSNPIVSFHLNQLLAIGEHQLLFLNQQNATLLQVQNAKASLNSSQQQDIVSPNTHNRS